jgi:hypothetical protein
MKCAHANRKKQIEILSTKFGTSIGPLCTIYHVYALEVIAIEPKSRNLDQAVSTCPL